MIFRDICMGSVGDCSQPPRRHWLASAPTLYWGVVHFEVVQSMHMVRQCSVNTPTTVFPSLDQVFDIDVLAEADWRLLLVTPLHRRVSAPTLCVFVQL